ncbi:hypothetical protein Micbo1qcDRAFT_165877, partial [Microdochium bolleyi]
MCLRIEVAWRFEYSLIVCYGFDIIFCLFIAWWKVHLFGLSVQVSSWLRRINKV